MTMFRWILPLVLFLCWAGGLACTTTTEPPPENRNTPPDRRVPPIDKTLRLSERPTTCNPIALDNVREPGLCNKGSGAFGYWHNDDANLPAYEYTLNHLTDPKALYPHSYKKEARSHFHQVGNDRINGIAYNDGYLELMGQERGVTLYNRYDPEHQNYAGGFSIIGEGQQAWNTAYRWQPNGAKTRRVFGMGYTLQVTQHNDIRVTHRWIAPPADGSFVIDDVIIQNLSDKPRTLRHYEYWDLNRHQLSFQPIRSGAIAPNSDLGRNAHNEPFDQQLSWKDGILQARYIWRGDTIQKDKSEATTINEHPATVFLAALGERPAEIFTDQQKFLGKGGIASPDGAKAKQTSQFMARHKAMDQPAMLVMRHDITLQPGESKSLRFAFGYLPEGKTMTMVDPWRKTDVQPLHATQEHWKKQAAYFTAPDAPLLSREVPWHSYYLLSATNVLDYYKTSVTSQGSAYLYLHGFDGAPRDQSLYSLPLTYLRPDLAKANLRLIMGLTQAKGGSISYSFHGFGMLEDAVIHTHPSDLDIFFLLAISEYLGATGDYAFLQEEVPYHPVTAKPPSPATSYTVLDHIRVAVDHLINFVKRGPNGLIRIWDGDWSDGIVWENTEKYSSKFTIEFGESIPNSQMAVYVLPRLAGLLASTDKALSEKMSTFAEELKEPTRKQFTGKWFLRAWMRDSSNKPVAAGKEEIDLEAQPWGLLANLLSQEEQTTLAQQVWDQLDKTSPIGPTLKPNTMVWPAVSQLMTWAYTRVRPDWAWASLQRQTLAAHAEAFPDQWFGIWSAPDGLDAVKGTTWSSVATPMTDWPVMNMNPHAMFLLGTFRVAGIEPTAQGLRIQPHGTPESYALDTPLLKLKVEKNRLEGEYRAHNDGKINLLLSPPKGKILVKVTLDGKDLTSSNNRVLAPLTFPRGKTISFSMTWK